MKHLLVLCVSLFLLNITIAQSTQLVYVYHTGSSSDSTAALSFESLLEPVGYTTTIIGTNDILTTDFSQFDAILIGSGTGMLGVWADSSTITPLIDAINNSDKPIIGLGKVDMLSLENYRSILDGPMARMDMTRSSSQSHHTMRCSQPQTKSRSHRTVSFNYIILRILL